jgi:hypothetical protein
MSLLEKMMSLANQNLTRWTVSVPKETDTALRCFLASRGMKKGDISKFIVDAVKWRGFEQTLAEVRQQVSDVPPDEMQFIIDEAIDAVHQDKRNEILGKEAKVPAVFEQQSRPCWH